MWLSREVGLFLETAARSLLVLFAAVIWRSRLMKVHLGARVTPPTETYLPPVISLVSISYLSCSRGWGNTVRPCDQREKDMSCFNITNDCCWFGLIFFFWNKVSCGPGWPPTPCVVRDAFVVEVLLPLTCAGFQACHNTQLLHDSRQTLHLVLFLSCPADYTAFSFVLLGIKMTFNPLALFIAYYKTREKFL